MVYYKHIPSFSLSFTIPTNTHHYPPPENHHRRRRRLPPPIIASSANQPPLNPPPQLKGCTYNTNQQPSISEPTPHPPLLTHSVSDHIHILTLFDVFVLLQSSYHHGSEKQEISRRKSRESVSIDKSDKMLYRLSNHYNSSLERRSCWSGRLVVVIGGDGDWVRNRSSLFTDLRPHNTTQIWNKL
ncbi:hypothetical protein HanXRQr2_Chr01g0001831 [Helianthus annuus]|uniref:Uncharacterized protein n=2 Tax=Helianthus annuus TaxID=4232 RepID=A0A251VMG3_HELAN|nr:hypothetical protein HanXRQr2_Chr01g0001831 [Helianthus annuus]KAJ0955334.1 hypothetical protein HanPSC8_Chr01g0001701 [Helianthus annuus]